MVGHFAGGMRADDVVHDLELAVVGAFAEVAPDVVGDAHAAERAHDARVVVDHEVGDHGHAELGQALLVVVERLAVDATHQVFQAVVADDAPAFAFARPHVDLMTVVAQPREDLVRAGPQRGVAAEDRVVDVEEDVHGEGVKLLAPFMGAVLRSARNRPMNLGGR